MAVRARLSTNAVDHARRLRAYGAGAQAATERAAEQTRPTLRNEVGKRTPVKSGKLLRGLYVEVERRGDRITLVAGFRGVPYARPVETGTRPHVIEPRRKAALAFDANGYPVVVKRVEHPGTAGAWMQRDGARAAWPTFRRNLQAELRRLYLGRR